MSSILKALEKAEESHGKRLDKSDGGLVRVRTTRPFWVVPVAVCCGGTVAAIGTFAAMGGFSRHAPAARVTAVAAKTAPVIVAPFVPVPRVPAVRPAQILSGTPAGGAAVPKPRVAPQKTPPVKAVRAALIPSSHPAANSSPVQPAPVLETAPSQTPEQALPKLRVTGIAWQNNGESSFAVVNDRAVLQGGTVDGFKVLEIHKDMVRFSGAKGSFDVPLGGDE